MICVLRYLYSVVERNSIKCNHFFFSMMAVVCAVVLPTALSGCSGGAGSGGGKTADMCRISVTVPPLEFFAKSIGGDSILVNVILPAGSDPETFEPGVAGMRGLSRSAALLSTGLMPFERELAVKAEENNRNLRILTVTDGIDLIYGTHTHSEGNHGDSHCADEADPHVWSSVVNARVIAARTLDALITVNPEHAQYYRHNHSMLVHKLDSLQTVWAGKLAHMRGSAFAIWHPSLSYLARDYGLRQMAISAEHKESSAKGRAAVIAAIREAKPVALFVEAGSDSNNSRMLGEAFGLHPTEINPMSSSWEDEMNNVINALVERKN